jgi:hypothetical protein
MKTLVLFVLVVLRANAGQGLLILEVSRSPKTHHSRQDSSGRVISSSQRRLPQNIQQSHDTDIHVLAGFEPAISAGKRPQTYVLDRAATVTGTLALRISNFMGSKTSVHDHLST